jgi:hypothetical protein
MLGAGCGHSDSYVVAPHVLGPAGTGSVVRLTFNVERDYWPAWTEDGRGILYSFIEPGSSVRHRCIGLLPAAGGTRAWQFCDNRAIRADSMNSFAAYALDTLGRLLAVEAVSGTTGFDEVPARTTLWLADTSTPYVRRTLLSLPIQFDTLRVSWISDLAWTSPTGFLALGQQFFTAPNCALPCHSTTEDTLFADHGGVVMTGTIGSGAATLNVVAGTEGATAYSLAEGGSRIVFTVAHDLRLFQVPIGGGAPTPMPDPPAHDTLANQVGELVGVSCRESSCIVARDGILITGSYWQQIPLVGWQYSTAFASAGGPYRLNRVSLQTGEDDSVAGSPSVFATPRISPVNGDVVVHVGGDWGHLQSFGSGGDLYLYHGLVP